MAARPDNGELIVIPFEQWLGYFAEPQTRDPDTHVNRIVSVDMQGNAAVAKTDLEWPDVHYVDYLSLLQVEGEWKIVNKIDLVAGAAGRLSAQRPARPSQA